jgi:hypothetical protein
LDIGGTPTGYGLQGLPALQIDRVVDLAAPDVAERVTAASLRLAYLHLAIAPGGRSRLRTLADYMRRYPSGELNIYVHDDVGSGRAVAVAAMLLLSQSGSWPRFQEHFTAAELMSLSACQSRAIEQFASALQSASRSPPGNPYSGARIGPVVNV